MAEANYRGDPFGRRALDGLVHVNFAQMSPPADGGLISAQERDVAAIYRTFAPAARSMAEVILRDRHLAEDAVQDAFLSLWLLGTAYKPDAHRRDALVRTLVHRRAVDVLRSRRSGISTVPLDEVTGSLVERSLGPEDIVVEADRASGVAVAVASLSPAKRQVLRLAYWDGHSHVEIACLLGIPLGTVKSRIRMAKLDLHELLHGSGDLGL